MSRAHTQSINLSSLYYKLAGSNQLKKLELILSLLTIQNTHTSCNMSLVVPVNTLCVHQKPLNRDKLMPHTSFRATTIFYG